MRSRTGRRLIATAIVGLCVVSGVACSDDAQTSSALDEVAPTRADVARDAGITFPASTADFRLVRIAAGQIDVTFTLDAADVDEFASGSGITLVDGERAITHASPLWDVAVTGDVAGGSSARNDVDRSAEVLTAGDTATVRLTLRPKDGS